MGKHEPSKRKLEKARKDGQIAKSPYFSQSFPMLALTTILFWQAPKALVDFKMLLNYIWVESFMDPKRALFAASYMMLYWSILALSGAFVVGLAAEFVQSGFSFDPQLALPKSKRVDFANGAQQVFKGLLNSWAVALRAILMAALLYWALLPCIEALPSGLLISQAAWIKWFSVSCTRLFKAVLAGLVINGAIDYGFKLRSHRKQLMMTDEEMRREHKEDEGDPHIKHARRQEHQSLISQDVIKRIRQAKVLIVESNSA